MSGYQFELSNDDDSYFYVFNSANGFEYTVKFKPSFWLQGNTFEISIENDLLLSNSGIFDGNIQVTVISIIRHFLEVIPNCAISYVCDTTGGQRRSKARNILFQRWFVQNNKTQEYIHFQGVFSKEEKIFYTGILYSIYNENKKELKEAFYMLNDELNK